jgi:hypothetical protein
MHSLKKLEFALGLLLLSVPALGADLAILHNGFSIRHERREMVGSVTRLYLGTDETEYVDIGTDQIERFEKDLSPLVSLTPPARPQTLNEVINAISDRHHIDPDLINSVIHAESGFNPRAVSPKGARGLMQLMPQTAAQLGVSNPFDPRSNVEGGTRYLSELLQLYNFDLIKALAAYNAGPQRVQHYRGVPPYDETRAYIARIVRDFNRKKLAQRKAASAATAEISRDKTASQHPAIVKRAAPVASPASH